MISLDLGMILNKHIFILLTQSGVLLEANIRKFVGWKILLRAVQNLNF